MTPSAIQARTARARDAAALLERLGGLRAAIRVQGQALRDGWALPDDTPDDIAYSLGNLADWLALRSHDLSALQPELSALGLSSLGRSEAHVMAQFDAVLAALANIAGTEPGHLPAPEAFTAGDGLLARRRDALFGEGAGVDRGADATRIMVTLPSEAADGPAIIDALVAAGADCLRINCAHDGPEAWSAMVDFARDAARAAGRPIPVEMDLGGPKLRLEQVSGAKARLFTGDSFVLTSGDLRSKEKRPQASLSMPELLAAMTLGTPVWIDDGKIRAVVEEREGNRAVLRVTGAPGKGARLKPEKGVNLPGAALEIPALTDDDRAALDAVLGGADMIAYSFVQTPQDVLDLVAEIDARRGARTRPALILKIETPLAVRNLPALIATAAPRVPLGLMIARGDLAVEMGFEALGETQEEILWLAQAAQVPVIWATQVLEGLIKEGQASRAETTDAAAGQRAECVMLNKGPHVVDGVRFLRQVLNRMDRHMEKKTAQLRRLELWSAPDARPVSSPSAGE